MPRGDSPGSGDCFPRLSGAIPLGEHLGLGCLADRLVTGLAGIECRLRLALLPAQPLELQPLHCAAMRTGHEEAPLVGGFILPFDPRQALDRRRRDQEQLLAVPEGRGSRLSQGNGVTFTVDIARIGIDLVQKHIARRHGAEPRGTVGAGQNQLAAREPLGQHRVAAVP